MSKKERVGFIGLGIMGAPMATNLLRSQSDLTVWNRTRERAEDLGRQGAQVAADCDDLFARVDVVILMLANAEAVDRVLGRGTTSFARRVRGRTIVQMGTVSPAYSGSLGREVATSGGRYVEAPVSGSRVPAERAELLVMLAGDEHVVDAVTPTLAPMCRELFVCGSVPAAMTMKLTVNIFLISMVAGLAEAFNFGRRNGVDVDRLRRVLDLGPMASAVSRIKSAKLAERDFSAQTTIADVLKNAKLIEEAAAASDARIPLLQVCSELLTTTIRMGHAESDMAAIAHALAAEH